MISLFPPTIEDRGAFDPIDLQLDRSGVTTQRLAAAPSGLRQLPADAFPGLVLLAGIAMGPHGVALLNPAMLRSIEPFVPVALAVLGVIVGLHAPITAEHRRRTVGWQVQAIVAGVLVLIGLLLVDAGRVGRGAFGERPLAAIVLAVAAATSSSLRTKDADSDALSLAVAAGAVVALIRAASPTASLLFMGETTLLATGVAIAGSLLLSRANITSEQRVFVFASVLLLGGVADSIATSALLSGMVGGLWWRAGSATVREDVERDMTYVQHSAIVLVLLIAGARADFSPTIWVISALYVVVRTAGKLTGGWAAARMIPAMTRGARLRLIAPGIFGVALALDVVHAGGDAFSPLLSVVVVGAIASSMMVSVLPTDGAE